MEIPQKYQERIINAFEEKGKEWLNSIPNIIKKYEKKFEIAQIQVMPKLSMNLLLTGYSKEFNQDVILKIGRPGYEVIIESDMLNNYKNFACKCFYTSEEDSVLILEKLYPGYTLKTLENRKDRVDEFIKMMKQTILDLKEPSKYSFYMSRIKKNFTSAMEEKEKYGDTAKLVPIALKYYKEVQDLNMPQHLLHGDLNLSNIVKCDNRWKVIDPQGVVAEDIFEIIKFIRGEIEREDDIENSIKETINYMSKEINYSKALIAKVTFIELVRANCWRISENANKETIAKNVIYSKKVLEYYKNNN